MALLLLAGCAQAEVAPSPSPGETSASSAPSSPEPSPPVPTVPTTPAASPTTLAVAWHDALQVDLGGTVLGLPQQAVVEQGEGWSAVTLSLDSADPLGLVIAGNRWSLVAGVLEAGAAHVSRPVVTDAESEPVSASFVADGRGVVIQVPDSTALPASVSFFAGERLVDEAVWESDSRILITPSELGRRLAPADPVAAVALVDAVMAQVGDDPRLESSSSVNQLACHMVGARDKATWNVETDREDKGLIGFMAARCN